MENKRIAHFIETDVPGGAETLLFDLCKHIQQTGNTPVVLHNGNPYFVEQCRKHAIEQHVPEGYTYFKSTKTLAIFAIKFSRFLKKQKIDIVHSHLFGPVTGAAAGAYLAGVPHIGTLHDVYMIEEKPSRIWLLRLACLFSTKLVTVSKTMEMFYRSASAFKTADIQTIYNGVDCKTVKNIPSRKGLANVAAGTCVIVSVGRLVELKRHDILLKALHQIEVKKAWHLLIVGDGPQRDTIEKYVAEYGLEDRVTLLGQRDDVIDLLSMADIFVQCSDTEGLSMSIMEGMAAGLPAVVSDVGGNRELIEHEQNGYIIPPADIDALAYYLKKLLGDAALRKVFRKNTIEKVRHQFDIHVTYEQYFSLYKQSIQ